MSLVPYWSKPTDSVSGLGNLTASPAVLSGRSFMFFPQGPPATSPLPLPPPAGRVTPQLEVPVTLTRAPMTSPSMDVASASVASVGSSVMSLVYLGAVLFVAFLIFRKG